MLRFLTAASVMIAIGTSYCSDQKRRAEIHGATTTERTIKDFAEERSHRDAMVSNETMRATAQAAILINGGAATAVLAFLSKDAHPQIAPQISLCLAIYGFGVVFAACMMFSSIRSLDYYNVNWRDIAFPGGFPGRPSDENALTKARCWWKVCLWCFCATIVCFLISSCFAAVTMATSG